MAAPLEPARRAVAAAADARPHDGDEHTRSPQQPSASVTHEGLRHAGVAHADVPAGPASTAAAESVHAFAVLLPAKDGAPSAGPPDGGGAPVAQKPGQPRSATASSQSAPPGSGYAKRTAAGRSRALRRLSAEARSNLLARSASDAAQADERCPGAHVLGSGLARASSSSAVTDADFEELRGFIDLGFTFSDDGSDCPQLCSTLPALQLCRAVSQHFKAEHGGRADSPVSTLISPDFSSPNKDGPRPRPLSIHHRGEPEDLLKVRLRHWAQAVACTIRQAC
eukprot:SM000062S19928  [mRNA]  locus=s62:394752:396025:- [translate_table: standard]